MISLCPSRRRCVPQAKAQAAGIVHTAQQVHTFRAVVHYNDQLAQAGESLLAAHNIRVVQGLQDLQPHAQQTQELICHEVCIAQHFVWHMHI